MLKTFCDCCQSEIRENESHKIIFNNVKGNGNLIRMSEQIEKKDFCEKCVEKVYIFILQEEAKK